LSSDPETVRQRALTTKRATPDDAGVGGVQFLQRGLTPSAGPARGDDGNDGVRYARGGRVLDESPSVKAGALTLPFGVLI